MSIKWQNRSSVKNKIPNIWVTHIGELRISVVFNHIQYPDRWIITCQPFFDVDLLESLDVESAKNEAVSLVKSRLWGILKGLG